MKNKIIAIKDIYIDDEIYPREKTNEDTVKDYCMFMQKGDIFPNIDVAKFQDKFWLIDGKHRLDANSLKGEKFVSCDTRNLGSKKDIFLASIKANLKHGNRLTKRDKIKIAGKLEGMKIDIKDIGNMLNMKFQRVDRILVKRLAKSNQLKNREEFVKKFSPKIVEVKNGTTRPVPFLNEAESQQQELETFLEFLKDTEFVMTKKRLTSVLLKIRKKINMILK